MQYRSFRAKARDGPREFKVRLREGCDQNGSAMLLLIPFAYLAYSAVLFTETPTA